MNLRPFTLPAHLSSHIGIEAIFPIHGLTPNLFKQAPSSGDEGYPVQVWYWTSHFPHTPHFMEEFRSPLLIRSGPIIYGSGSAPSGYAFSQVEYCWKNPKMDCFCCSPQVSIVEVFPAILLIGPPNFII